MSVVERLRIAALRPAAGTWVLLGALGLLVAIEVGEIGSDARNFRPRTVEPSGILAPLVRAAGEEWSPGILRAAAVIAGVVLVVVAVATAMRSRPLRGWLAALLTAAVVVLLLAPGVLLQIGLRDATADWFHVNDSTYQIELGGDLLRDGQNPYGYDYGVSGLERFYTRDGTVSQRVLDRQVALHHFAYFPATPLSAAAWSFLPEPWEDYRVLIMLATLLAGAVALLFEGPLGWRLALGALIAANPIAVKSAWFGQADAPSLLCTLLAFALAIRSRYLWSAALIAFAILLKQFALVAVPFLALILLARAGRPELKRAAAVFAGVLAVGFLPFLIADLGALWEDTVRYGGEIYRIIGYGLGPLLLEAGILDDRFGYYPFIPLAVLVWLPVTVLLLRWQFRSGALWTAAAGFSASLFTLFFISRVFQETYLIWPLTGIALAGLLWIQERAPEPTA